MRCRFVVFVTMICVAMPQIACAEGEAVDGFPNWGARVLVEWMNRARSDPQADLASCSGSTCADKSCYAAIAPRHANANFLHSAQFHAAHMDVNDYNSYPSQCTLVGNINSIYPQTCAGAASCSCTQGALTADSSAWTDPFTRMSLFGASGSSEVIAVSFTDPDAAFYAMLYDSSPASGCGIGSSDPYRFNILAGSGTDSAVGAGYATGGLLVSAVVMDIGSPGVVDVAKIPSGAHFPQQAASVDAWVNWYDSAGPSLHRINVGGVYSDMTLDRGSQLNGAWHANVSGVGSGCHRYLFAFKDSGGADVFYPTHGSLAIGDGSAQCPDFSYVEPPIGTGFDRIFEYNFEP